MEGYVSCWGLQICYDVDTVNGQVDKVPARGFRKWEGACICKGFQAARGFGEAFCKSARHGLGMQGDTHCIDRWVGDGRHMQHIICSLWFGWLSCPCCCLACGGGA